MRLNGRTAIVTGAGSGLGKAFAARLAADGANVVIADIANAEAAAAELGKGGARTASVDADVSKEADAQRIADAAIKAFGRIDILVNNAGYFSRAKHGPFESIGVEEWRKMMDINVLGLYLCARAVVPHMRRHGGGRIINISSGTVLKGRPMFLHYVTSKGAVIGFTRALARELGKDNITVNAIAPGFTLSEGVLADPTSAEQNSARSRAERALARDEHPQDLVGTVSFLASDDAAFMTGQTLSVDGGSVFL